MLTLGIDIGGSSVKAAGLDDDQIVWTGRSRPYRRPSIEQIRQSIREAVEGRAGNAAAAGLCVPGPLAEDRRSVAISVNVPELVGVTLADLITSSLPLTVVTDARAAAHDLYASRRLTGRLLCLVLGTGVGAAVLDESGPLRVNGDSPGHFGQLDVSLEAPPDMPPIGPDGGAGSLEAYVGAAGLAQAYGADTVDFASRIGPSDPPLRALARAIRIAHAIYRPHHVILAGGLGVRLRHLLDPLRRLGETNLTRIARPGWTLTTADNDFHAAAGAARLAAAQ